MRRSMVIMLAVALLAAATAIGGWTVAGGAATVPTKAVAITSSRCAGGNLFCFKPASLTVTRGTKVVWKNMTQVAHTVTRCSPANCGVSGGTGTDPKLGSPFINPGRTFAFVFHHPGTYRYFCKVHGYAAMHGIITVR